MLWVLGFLHLHLKTLPEDISWYKFVTGTNHKNYEYQGTSSLISDAYVT
jgi:hypothetical protein